MDESAVQELTQPPSCPLSSPSSSKALPEPARSTRRITVSTQACRHCTHPRPLLFQMRPIPDALVPPPFLTFRNATHEPGRQISLNRCTFMQNRRARLTSEARGQQPLPSLVPASLVPAAASGTSTDGGGRAGGGDGEREIFTLPPSLLCGTSDAALADPDSGGGSGNLRNSPDVLGSRAGGSRGAQPPPILPPAASLSVRPWPWSWPWPCRCRCRDGDGGGNDGERAYPASSDEHACSPRAEERVTLSRRHLAYSCRLC